MSVLYANSDALPSSTSRLSVARPTCSISDALSDASSWPDVLAPGAPPRTSRVHMHRRRPRQRCHCGPTAEEP